MKPVHLRTAEEKEMLHKVMSSDQIQSFERYPEKVRESLTGSAMFAYFPPGRVLVAEGHPSVAMYFIISGQASVSKMVFDAGLKQMRSVEVAVMNAGDAFGEVKIFLFLSWKWGKWGKKNEIREKGLFIFWLSKRGNVVQT